MKAKILYFLLLVSVGVSVSLYVLTNYDLVEKGSVSSNSDSLELPASEHVIEEENTYGSDATNEIVDKKPETEPADTEYIYYLTDDKIIEAINDGKETDEVFRESFKLPLLSSTSKDSTFEYMDVFINTPYRLVTAHSYNQYMLYDKTASIDDVMSLINYNSISFAAYVQRGTARMLATELIQDGTVIESYKINNTVKGDMKMIYFSVDAIDFREPAILKIFEKSNPSNYSEYQISFEDHVK
ncbi:MULTISPECIES: hypothetical protein [Paenibacillus]|uniref:Regulatory protein YycH-like domain-containing protein n=1 Tax=Paenibacillus cucumis (ex Kampfer et al. 2016) TaxID=1776858 RepID=A0ABS7KIA8_9BACL|nr:hypothetical protein [Paenibacillus cucumis (ex Kampfer et al. 2016)]MBY0203686.1 hypothetical protein [Paenibacillus cucumis (ex Kampfer et al. 2016)]